MRRQEKEGYKGERKREGQRYGDVRFLLLSFYFRTEYIIIFILIIIFVCLRFWSLVKEKVVCYVTLFGSGGGMYRVLLGN